MKIKKITQTIMGQIQRSRTITERTYGKCWPQNGQKKTIMWQSTGWPASGKNIPRTARYRPSGL